MFLITIKRPQLITLPPLSLPKNINPFPAFSSAGASVKQLMTVILEKSKFNIMTIVIVCIVSIGSVGHA